MSAANAVRGAAASVRRRVVGFERDHAASFGVLLYHRIATTAVDPWGLAVAADHFDEHLAAMRSLGNVVSLESEVARSRFSRFGRRNPRLAITFDDGYEDNLRAALPVLERHDVPATFFIATGYLDRANFWWDAFDATVFDETTSVEQLSVAATQVGLLADVDLAAASVMDRAGLHAMLYARMGDVRAAEAPERVEALAAAVAVRAPRPSGRPMTSDELVEFAAHPLVTIGAHTANHPRLSRLDRDATLREINDGARALDHLLGHRQRLFAYPFGDTSPATAAATRDAGFRRAFTTEARWTAPSDGPMMLPRLVVDDSDGDAFTRWIDARGR